MTTTPQVKLIFQLKKFLILFSLLLFTYVKRPTNLPMPSTPQIMKLELEQVEQQTTIPTMNRELR